MTLDELLKEIKTEADAEKHGLTLADHYELKNISAHLKKFGVDALAPHKNNIYNFIINYCDDLEIVLPPSKIYIIKYKNSNIKICMA